MAVDAIQPAEAALNGAGADPRETKAQASARAGSRDSGFNSSTASRTSRDAKLSASTSTHFKQRFFTQDGLPANMMAAPSSSSAEQHSQSQRKMGGRTLTEVSKTQALRIYVYINGNTNKKKRMVTVDPKHINTLEIFLDWVTQLLLPDFGAVRKVVTLDGAEVKELTALEDGQSYVAVGPGGFKRVDYGTTSEKQSTQTKPNPATQLRPIRRKKTTVESQYMKPNVNAKNILLVLNGDASGKGHKVLVTKRSAPTWDKFLEFVTQRLIIHLQSDIKKLYALDGTEVTSLKQLKDVSGGGVYVCVDRPPLRIPDVELNSDGELQKCPPKLATLPAPKDKRRKHMYTPSKADIKARVEQAALQAARREKLVQEGAEELFSQIIDELSAEEFLDTCNEMLQMLAGVRDGAQVALDKLSGLDIVREYDHLIPSIIETALDRSSDESRVGLFHEVMQTAADGRLAHWETDPLGVTSLVILLDQFPRILYRGTRYMYELDGVVGDIVVRAIESGVFQEIEPLHRLYGLFALNHQEDAERVQLGLQEWELVKDQFPEDDPVWESVETWQRNLEILQEFGRYPARNAVLGRETTEEETKFLLGGTGRIPGLKDKKKPRFSLSSIKAALPLLKGGGGGAGGGSGARA